LLPTSGNAGSGAAKCRNCTWPFGLDPFATFCFDKTGHAAKGKGSAGVGGRPFFLNEFC
jgi:hypothetical protein